MQCCIKLAKITVSHTVGEPLIVDPPTKGHSNNNNMPPSRRGQPLYKGQSSIHVFLYWSQSVLYSEASTVHVSTYILCSLKSAPANIRCTNLQSFSNYNNTLYIHVYTP